MIYQKLYAKLMSEVDDSLEMIDGFLKQEACGRNELALVGGKLQKALQDLEDLYVRTDEVFHQSLTDLMDAENCDRSDKCLRELEEVFSEMGPVSPAMFKCVAQMAQIIAKSDTGHPREN